jgi:hypothetical protein
VQLSKGNTMPDPVVHIGENSPQHVAYKLLEMIAKVENKYLYEPSEKFRDYSVADREWILKTYAQCLTAVQDRGYHDIKSFDAKGFE